MIGLAKYRSMSPEQQLRKVQRWLKIHSTPRSVLPPALEDHCPSWDLLTTFLAHSLEQGQWKGLVGEDLLAMLAALGRAQPDPWSLHRMDLLFSRDLGIEAAEWDLVPASRPPLGTGPGLMVYCEDLRSPFNIGSIFRTAEAFGFSRVLLSAASPRPGDSPRLDKSSMGATGLIPWQAMDLDILSAELPLFALELGGTPLGDFVFPDHGVVVLGSEELGVRPETLARCRSSAGVVTIPLWGTKASLNVGVGFGILAQAWARSVQDHSLA